MLASCDIALAFALTVGAVSVLFVGAVIVAAIFIYLINLENDSD